MSIIAEALKKAQRKGKKGGDPPPPFDLGKAPAAGGAKPAQAPRAKPVSAASSAEAAKSVVGARPAVASKPAAAKPAKPKGARAAKKKQAGKAGKVPFLKQRKVRWAVMVVSAVAVVTAGMYYVYNVYLPGVSAGAIASAPQRQVAAPQVPQADVEPSGEQTDGPEATDPAAEEIVVPPVPELELTVESLAEGAEIQPMDMAPEPESSSQQGQAGELPADASVSIGAGSRSPPAAGTVPPSIISKGAQEKPLREDIYHFNMAVHFQRKGDVREALSEYEEVIRLSSHNAEVYSNMGVLYNQIGEFEEAVAVLRKALLIDPQYSKARNNLAVAYYRAGQYQLALEQANQAINIDPGNLDALNNLGLIYRKMDRLELAEQSFNRALAVDTGYAAAHYNLALLYEQTGQLALASRHYRSFLAGGGASEQFNAKVSARLRELTPGS